MILIADAGGTKIDWTLVKRGVAPVFYTTSGFNPTQYPASQLTDALKRSWRQQDAPVSVYYYGAGCWNDHYCGMTAAAIQRVFPNVHIEVYGDLLGAARATCRNSPGIVGILGTGSNSCEYDGERITDQIPSLGFCVGDEGSGAFLGKKLLQAYFYRELEVPLKRKLETQFAINKKILVEKIYSSIDGASWLARFARFVIDHQEHIQMQTLIDAAFGEFVERHLLKYSTARQTPVHLVGGIAFWLKNRLEYSLHQYGLQLGTVIQRPIEALVKFHTSQDGYGREIR